MALKTSDWRCVAASQGACVLHSAFCSHLSVLTHIAVARLSGAVDAGGEPALFRGVALHRCVPTRRGFSRHPRAPRVPGCL